MSYQNLITSSQEALEAMTEVLGVIREKKFVDATTPAIKKLSSAQQDLFIQLGKTSDDGGLS